MENSELPIFFSGSGTSEETEGFRNPTGLAVETFFIAMAGQTADVVLMAGGVDRILQSGR